MRKEQKEFSPLQIEAYEDGAYDTLLTLSKALRTTCSSLEEAIQLIDFIAKSMQEESTRKLGNSCT